MKLAREPASSRSKPCASLKKPHESCPFAASCWPSQEESRPWSEISFSLRNLPVRALYFGLVTWVQPSHPASPRPSSVTGENLVLTHRLFSRFPLSAAVRQFWHRDRWYERSGLWIERAVHRQQHRMYAVNWSKHALIPYRLITSTLWVHPGREAARAGSLEEHARRTRGV